MSAPASLKDFYKWSSTSLPDAITQEIGHFNVFETKQFFDRDTGRRAMMPYQRRSYYKISWMHGSSQVQYADKVIDIRGSGLLLGTPKIPYHWIPQDSDQTGMFCIFTADFLTPAKAGVRLDDCPVFQPGNTPVFQLSKKETAEVEYIFRKMQKVLSSDYRFKYDLLRNLVMELIHYGQMRQPMMAMSTAQNASQRISSLFIELLERQFPLGSPHQALDLRTPKDFADRLAVHVNHLNKVLKEVTGNTTTELISGRILQEAKIMLKHTDWSVGDIGYSLGFEDTSHFSHFFKKQTALKPMEFRA
jgi:AraC-like DNA-binding protein